MLYVSPSQISTYRLCPMKWWSKSIAKQKEPQHPSAVRGEAFHKEMEEWITEGLPTSSPEATMAARAFLAHPLHENTQVEASFKMPIPGFDDVMMNGRIDLKNDTGIGDWKTMGTFQYALDKEALKQDMQANVYMNYFFSVPPRSDSGTFTHFQVNLGEKKIRVVDADIDAGGVRAYYDTIINPAVREMRRLSTVTDGALVPRVKAACKSYGGCPHRIFCERFNTDLNWRNDMNARLQAALGIRTVAAAPESTPAPVTASTPAVRPPEVTAPLPVSEVLEQLIETYGYKYSTVAKMPEAEQRALLLRASTSGAKTLVEPNKTCIQEPPEQVAEKPVVRPRGRPRKLAAVVEAVVNKDSSTYEPPAPPTPNNTVSAGSYSDAKTRDIVVEFPTACVPPTSRLDLVLLIDVNVIDNKLGGATFGSEDLAVVLKPLMDEVAAELGTPYYNLEKFGNGIKLLAAKVQANREMFRNKVIAVNSWYPCSGAVLEVLYPWASAIFTKR